MKPTQGEEPPRAGAGPDAPLAATFRVLLALVWLAGVTSRLADWGGAVTAVQAYRILPNTAARPVAWALPAAEAILAVALLLRCKVRVTAAVSAVLVAAFAGAIVSAWVRGLDIGCGCSRAGLAGGGALAYTKALGRDGAVLAVAVCLFVLADRLPDRTGAGARRESGSAREPGGSP